MAGHSQFKNIMYRKGAQDKRRARLFTKIIREITVAVKSGAHDPNANPRLRSALNMARAENMPKDNIDRAIKKATEGVDGANYDDIRYEGYAASGVAVIIEALTDNRNRTASDVRSLFNKYGGNMGETGSVAFMFERVAQITYPLSTATAEAMFEAALDAGATNVETDAERHLITAAPEDMHTVRDALEARFGAPQAAVFLWVPQTTAPVSGDAALSVLKMIDALEELDDVQNVYANFELDAATLDAFEKSA
ncbi:MAG: YebC/PmpR family DNA-binding transcriptional regulator [Alphaproteobacteria bacterium]|nr:YebC/PmpR family DNA-binding transcriptional regulator [Alphaproteobacteria bacterium]